MDGPQIVLNWSLYSNIPPILPPLLHPPWTVPAQEEDPPFPFPDRKWDRNLSHIQFTSEPPGVSLRLRPREWGHCWLLF